MMAIVTQWCRRYNFAWAFARSGNECSQSLAVKFALVTRIAFLQEVQ